MLLSRLILDHFFQKSDKNETNLFLSPSKMYKTLTKDVIGYDNILLTFLVKVVRGLKENSSVAYRKSFLKNENKIIKI